MDALGKGEIPILRSRYPHMLPEDVVVWREYLGGDQVDFNCVWYDVHVGHAMSVPLGSPAYMHRVVAGISRKRIDVVGLVGDELRIIELKGHAGMESIGQVVTYRQLFLAEFKTRLPVTCWIICGTADRDILDLAEKLEVQIIPLRGVLL